MLASLEPDPQRDYRELDSPNLYFLVKKSGTKYWQLRYKKNDGVWSFLSLGAYPQVNGQQRES